jgi:nucleoside 2-deoxyribosyltransferase
MATKPRCYVASPLGFTEAGRVYYRKVFLPALAAVVEPIDPWAYLGDVESVAVSESLDKETARAIGERNAAAIRSASLLAAYLDGQEVDSGTAAEVGYAAALPIPCFGLRTDVRQSGEAGLSVNLQVFAFITGSGGRIVQSLEDLVDALSEAAS